MPFVLRALITTAELAGVVVLHADKDFDLIAEITSQLAPLAPSPHRYSFGSSRTIAGTAQLGAPQHHGPAIFARDDLDLFNCREMAGFSVYGHASKHRESMARTLWEYVERYVRDHGLVVPESEKIAP